jgi:hypothetical protein
MGRADMPEDKRRQFYLYVDEFQNFATESFATILSEARKYALNLTVANQYISQMEQPVRDAVFGNVGTIVSFRVSPDDAPFLTKYFEPQFEAGDLIQQHSRFFFISMMIEGEKAPAFSAKTLDLPATQEDHTPKIIEITRKLYSRDVADVDAHIRKNTLNMQEAISQPTVQAKLPSPSHRVGRMATNLVQAGVIERTDEFRKDSGNQSTAPAGQAPTKRKRTRRGGQRNRRPIELPNPEAKQQQSGNRPNPSEAGDVVIKLR